MIFFVGAKKTGSYFRARFRLEDGTHRMSRMKFGLMGDALRWGTRVMKTMRAWGWVK